MSRLRTFFAKHLCHEALLPGCNPPQIVLRHASGCPLLLLRADIHLCGHCGVNRLLKPLIMTAYIHSKQM